MSKNEKMIEKLGRIHLYAGDGKGKSTAVTGLAARARGRGLDVLFVQFLKSGNSAELESLRKLGVAVESGQPSARFVFQMNEEEKAETRAFFTQRLDDAFDRLEEEDINLLVLDEIMGAISTGMVDEDRLVERLASRPPHVEVALTGRDPSDRLIDLADYYSEIRMRKHPFETEGLAGRAGIEF